MEKRTTYYSDVSDHYLENMRIVLDSFPSFTKQYFRAIEPRTSAKTRLSYAYDLKVFFKFLQKNNPVFGHMDLKDITLQQLEALSSDDIEEYLEYLKMYTDDNGKVIHNTERGLHRKLASLRSFYGYYFRTEKITRNPALIVDMPKLHKQEIVRLDPDEVAEFLDLVDHGPANLTPQKQRYYEKNRLRDLAICTLLLGTGIRISECVGLDLEDVDFKNNRIKIIRKGGKEDFVYFGEEVATALSNYMQERCKIDKLKEGHEHALFISVQKRRICVQSIENMVEDYANQITTVKHITPHKLRSTYGTALYRQTNDIYLVAEVLGHNDVNTTKKHYAALDEDHKRRAANEVSLRKD